jgi:hypothetical protein
VADDVIRFGVGTPDGARSATWRVWKHATSEGDDVYVGARRIAGQFKVSLHRDGTCLYGFSRQHVEGPASILPPGEPRQRRFTPTEIGPGFVRAVSVWIPASEVAVPSYGGSEDGPIYWHPTPDEGRAASFTVSLSSPTTLVSTWPGSRAMGTKLVGTFGLSSGWTVWVTVNDEDIDQVVAATWAERKAKLRIGRRTGRANRSTFGPWASTSSRTTGHSTSSTSSGPGARPARSHPIEPITSPLC